MRAKATARRRAHERVHGRSSQRPSWPRQLRVERWWQAHGAVSATSIGDRTGPGRGTRADDDLALGTVPEAGRSAMRRIHVGATPAQRKACGGPERRGGGPPLLSLSRAPRARPVREQQDSGRRSTMRTRGRDRSGGVEARVASVGTPAEEKRGGKRIPSRVIWAPSNERLGRDYVDMGEGKGGRAIGGIWTFEETQRVGMRETGWW
ncbi:hypothetical protein DFH06DRAFT_1132557 [Mycena polygramma]|nr:hypothetical protein DFH06DRAFT_1132557 [Mycena polygramma]